MVFAWVVAREIRRGDIGHRFGVDSNDLGRGFSGMYGEREGARLTLRRDVSADGMVAEELAVEREGVGWAGGMSQKVAKLWRSKDKISQSRNSSEVGAFAGG